MKLLLVLSSLLFWSGLAGATGTCPDFFRFVDFGLTGSDGKVYRGGSTFRAEGLDGATLLHLDKTVCIDVPENGTDGHGYIIPVVESIIYKPETSLSNLSEFRLRAVDDTMVAATSSIEQHQEDLQNDSPTITRGENFLCVSSNAGSLSCQIVSPYPGNVPLVVYCNEANCKMPALAINKQLLISASWQLKLANKNDDTEAATAMLDMAKQISEFLEPLSALGRD